MQDLLTFTSEIKQINLINTYLHLIKNLYSEFLKKAEPLLTLPKVIPLPKYLRSLN